MTRVITVAQVDAIRELFDPDVQARSYSGRSYGGGECFGIVCDGPDTLIKFMLAAVAVLDDESWQGFPENTEELFRRCEQDSMGRQVIYYWPGLTYQQDDADSTTMNRGKS